MHFSTVVFTFIISHLYPANCFPLPEDPNDTAPNTLQYTPGTGDLYPCADDRLTIFESEEGEPSGLAQYQYNVIRHLQTRFDNAKAEIPDVPFNVEVSVDDGPQGKAMMIPAAQQEGFPAPPIITVEQAAGCIKALADAVGKKAMGIVRLPDRNWAIVPTQGARLYIAHGAYSARSPQAVAVT